LKGTAKPGTRKSSVNENKFIERLLKDEFRKGTVMKSPMKSAGLKFITTIALVIAASALASAQTGDPNEKDKEVLTDLQQQMLKRISVDFRNTPIEDVLRIMAEQADVDIVKSPQVTGNVTATLTNVPLEEALGNILAAQTQESLTSKIYHITYADVTEVEKALKKFVSSRGSLSANPGTSHIIITDTESNIQAIDTFIAEVDQITPQILVEVRIYDITSRDKLDFGIEWLAGRDTGYPGGLVGLGSTDATNPIRERSPFDTGYFSAPTNKTTVSTAAGLRFGWLNGNIDIDVLLTAQEEITDAKLLANPRILVLDNENALFNIVTEHPYVERTITGNIVTETVKFKNVGVNLEVRPHVTRDGMIRLHIKPEFNVFVTRVTVATSDVPVVDTRKADTITLVKDGQTVVLGGLRKKDVNKQTNKIPLLGDIPLVGGLFRFEGEDTAITELVVFITPQIIRTPVMSEAEKRAYEVTQFYGPGVNMTRAEEDAAAEEE
jgi:type IV pilus secretin PilQ/predicted competence protein